VTGTTDGHDSPLKKVFLFEKYEDPGGGAVRNSEASVRICIVLLGTLSEWGVISYTSLELTEIE
jgi:hypothetical protein